MNRIITFDNGNSHPNFAIWENGKLIKQMLFTDYQDLPKNFNQMIYCEVGKPIIFPEFIEKKKIPIKNKKNAKFFLDMPSHYTLDTLGEDRLACAYAVFKQNHIGNSIIIDAGTFITVDLVNSHGFGGGFIFPGLKLISESYKSGAKLPLVDKINIEKQCTRLPQNTQEAMFGAIQSYIRNLFTIFDCSIDRFIITGGDLHLINSFAPINITETNKILIHQGLFLIGEKIS